MKSLQLDFAGPLHVADFGGSGTAMVLVHGLGGSHLNWAANGHVLARRHRVLAPDLAGFGLTPTAGRSCTVEANLTLLERYVRSLGAPVVLAGNSMGGMLSVLFAAKFPELVRALVLVNPAVPLGPGAKLDPQVVQRFAAFAVPGVGELILKRGAEKLGPEGVLRQLMLLCCVDASRIPAEVYRAHVELAQRRAREMPWSDASFLQAARSLLLLLARKGRFLEKVAAVRAPTLLVHGAHDRLIPLASSRALATARPDWRLEVLDDAGHVPQLEAAERFNHTVLGWLEQAVPPAQDGQADADHPVPGPGTAARPHLYR